MGPKHDGRGFSFQLWAVLVSMLVFGNNIIGPIFGQVVSFHGGAVSFRECTSPFVLPSSYLLDLSSMHQTEKLSSLGSTNLMAQG